MGCIGKEIAQTRTYIDPKVKEPLLNYKLTFPITVFDAVRQSIDDENSRTLTDVLNEIFLQLRNKQPIFPAKPANYLMSFAGTAGDVGAVQMSYSIPWDPAEQTHEKVPTEKAVGELMFKLGLVDSEGKPINDPESKHVRWSDIIGRPLLYNELGNNEGGTITQKAITDVIKQLEGKLEEVGDISATKVNVFLDRLKEHIANTNNPHAVTIDQIDGVSQEEMKFHVETAINPHGITPRMIGLGNVENTKDIDKPVSNATKQEINKVYDSIETIDQSISGLDFLIGTDYDQPSGHLTLTFRHGDTISLYIPINGLVDDITYDSDTKEIVFTELSGDIHRIDVSELFIRYVGSNGVNINVLIDGNQDTGEQIIRAEIISKSIVEELIADSAVVNRVLAPKSVTSDKIQDYTINTINLADESVTTEKIPAKAIIGTKIADRAVSGRSLFTTKNPYRVLSVIDPDSDPIWSQIHEEMLVDNSIGTRHIQDKSVTTDKLAIRVITTDRIDNGAVTHDKLALNSVTGENVVEYSLSGSKLAPGALFPGTPMIATRPNVSANNTQVPDTHWVREVIDGWVFEHKNLGKRVVDGSNLFSSSERNRVLTVGRANSDPAWTQVNNGMIEDNAINTNNIINRSVTSDKLREYLIKSIHISDSAVQTQHIADDTIIPDKIWPGPGPNYLLVSDKKDGHPTYNKLTSEMIEPNAIDTMAIQDGAVTPAKVESSHTDGNVILGVTLKGTTPQWTKVSNQMISTRAVDGRTLFSSPVSNKVLITGKPATDPTWGKINEEMIQEDSIKDYHISDDAIDTRHIKEAAITGKHIAEWSIPGTAILPRTINGSNLFTSKYPNQVLAIHDPYTDAVWSKIQTDMITDKAITKEKMFQADMPYRVLGATQAGVPPEYLMITHQFIVDGTIIPSKLEYDFVLQGTPELTIHPAADADNYQLASTKWVRKIIRDMCLDFVPAIMANFTQIPPEVIDEEWRTRGTNKDDPEDHDYFVDRDFLEKLPEDKGFDTIPPTDGGVSGGSGDGCHDSNGYCTGCPFGKFGIFPYFEVGNNQLKDHSVDGPKLMTHPYGPRVLGITKANENVEFILIEEDLLVDGAVTTNKIQRDLHLLGSPVLEVRPSPLASDNTGGGTLIPDCQWVLDRIGSTKEEIIAVWREITAEEMHKEWMLHGKGTGELDPNPGGDDSGSGTGGGSCNGNCDPAKIFQAGIIVTEYIQDRSITATKLFTTSKSNRVLGVKKANSNPEYLQINTEMIEDRAVTARKIFTSDTAYRALIVNESGGDPVWDIIKKGMLDIGTVDTEQIVDRAVVHAKIAQAAIDMSNIMEKPVIDEARLLDKAVTTRKLASGSVTDAKIAKESVSGFHMKKDVVLPGHPTVEADTIYEVRSLRNIILSPNKPTTTGNGFNNGDIWFQYI